MVVASHELVFDQVDTENNRLKWVLPPSVGHRFVPNLDVIRTEGTDIEIFMKLVLTQVVGVTMCIEGSNE